ncbi:MAG: AmpG family muropeptide MFS transporter [Gammaproteobacteria bacterium]|nr:AmpG family muropeptide MFS transporter [Gammaproteobacteria bacterium]MDH3846393.1 AmpG family muropeptide MFS transporter [Gammaproteobacteria bacterium]MDH3863414.1 AmpG family muropeptide MFS transporter [Gammaproteobacteria bacterium]MDH3904699.1 AmpG family muropeptide MFS transporter [Gammaproteobacteria bacterium]MDH3953465.1 AmpG family muropeptide MFS transporter [Gammaproteobacteria bacterium]
MSAEVQQGRSRRETFREAILNRRMLICLFTGFTSGLPLYVLIQLVPAWLRTEGVGLAEIGFFALIQFPYTWKFLWSPLMDRFTLPFLGHRRGWMLLTQLALFAFIATLGFIKPDLSIWTVAYISAAVAFFSASQDIVLDAYRRELLPDVELGLGNAIHVQAYRLSGLVPGTLALILADHLPWHTVFIIVAAFMLVGIVMTLSVSEAIAEPTPPRTIREAVIEPFREFLGRAGVQSALYVLAFLFLYKLGDSMATALQSPFFIDVGFTLTQIGTVAKFSSLTAAIVGGMVGGLVMVKLPINRALWLFGLVQIVSILGFAALSVIGPNLWMLGFAVAFEYLGVGLGTAALIAFIARSTHVAFAATQFALFTALAATPRTLASAVTGVIVEQTGWTNFFLLCTVLAVPGMLLLLKVAPWNEDAA